MTQTNGETAEEFARALGVTVVEVDGCASGMCGRCMLWWRGRQAVQVCRELEAEERRAGFSAILADL